MVAWHTVALRFVGCCFFKWKIHYSYEKTAKRGKCKWDM